MIKNCVQKLIVELFFLFLLITHTFSIPFRTFVSTYEACCTFYYTLSTSTTYRIYGNYLQTYIRIYTPRYYFILFYPTQNINEIVVRTLSRHIYYTTFETYINMPMYSIHWRSIMHIYNYLNNCYLVGKVQKNHVYYCNSQPIGGILQCVPLTVAH